MALYFVTCLQHDSSGDNFTWNVKICFLGKNKTNISICRLLKILPSGLSIQGQKLSDFVCLFVLFMLYIAFNNLSVILLVSAQCSLLVCCLTEICPRISEVLVRKLSTLYLTIHSNFGKNYNVHVLVDAMRSLNICFHAKVRQLIITNTVNVLKFWALYSLLFWPKFCFSCTGFLKYLVEWQTV